MVINTEKLQEVCKKVLDAVDNNSALPVSSSVELLTEGRKLFINITNMEYYVSINLDLDNEVDSFRVVVDAHLFLNLIAKMTTEDIELTISDKSLVVKGNGTYKVPIITDAKGIVNVPKITIDNVTNEFTINNEDLQNILNFNTKEVMKNIVNKPVQKMYYLDNQGCITYTNSACVNSFTLNTDVKLIFNLKLVKLFKLLKSDVINVKLGYDKVGNTTQAKITFKEEGTEITSILLNDESLINEVPVYAIRGRANKVYPYNVTLRRTELLKAIARISFFLTKAESVVILSFDRNEVKMYDLLKVNNDCIPYESANLTLDNPYTIGIDVFNLKNTLEGCSDEYINLSFGDGKAFVMTRGNIKDVIPHTVIA